MDFKEIISIIKSQFPNEDFIPLHRPYFIGNEKKYVNDCLDSTFVSSVGKYVNQFEESVAKYTGTSFAIATVNGTTALHAALVALGVKHGHEVITQSLTFVATTNAIAHAGANPIFIDSSKDNLAMCPNSLEEFLHQNAFVNNSGHCVNKITGKRIMACIPMHVFGHSAKTFAIKKLCDQYKISLIEDCAESLGSFDQDNRHLGHHGEVSILSFNGNKTITTGGGGMIITNNQELALKLKHITTTAKKPHEWEFFHDQIGFNYRLPNLNAALGLAQMENLNQFIQNKRELAAIYQDKFSKLGLESLVEPKGYKSNYWLNALRFKNLSERDQFLKYSNDHKVMTRPLWILNHKLPMFQENQKTSMENALIHEETIVNIPSSFRPLPNS